jgi:hypothetical protein
VGQGWIQHTATSILRMGSNYEGETMLEGSDVRPIADGGTGAKVPSEILDGSVA